MTIGNNSDAITLARHLGQLLRVQQSDDQRDEFGYLAETGGRVDVWSDGFNYYGGASSLSRNGKRSRSPLQKPTSQPFMTHGFFG